MTPCRAIAPRRRSRQAHVVASERRLVGYMRSNRKLARWPRPRARARAGTTSEMAIDEARGRHRAAAVDGCAAAGSSARCRRICRPRRSCRPSRTATAASRMMRRPRKSTVTASRYRGSGDRRSRGAPSVTSSSPAVGARHRAPRGSTLHSRCSGTNARSSRPRLLFAEIGIRREVRSVKVISDARRAEAALQRACSSGWPACWGVESDGVLRSALEGGDSPASTCAAKSGGEAPPGRRSCTGAGAANAVLAADMDAGRPSSRMKSVSSSRGSASPAAAPAHAA